MKTLEEFLEERIASGPVTTEDALTSFLPLARDVATTHVGGHVAPLQGIGALRVDGIQIYFSEVDRKPIRRANAQVHRLSKGHTRSAVDVVAEFQVTTDVDEGEENSVNLAIGASEQTIVRPVFVPGYKSWEHLVDCHDPLTDVFSLGLILASLCCGLDFHETSAITLFADKRLNLFELVPGLHPVLARAIVSMTELDRNRRAQDLPSLIRTLENYRDQEVDLEFELTQTLHLSEVRNKQSVVLKKLREKLFEISKRNRLLHFRPTMQTVNLTQASIPLSFDIQHIRPDQILVWNAELEKAVGSGKPQSLNRHLNFNEVLYLPSQLERLLADARKDLAEYGFAQLRLVACFLQWTNLKEDPAEHFDSPLVLVPVRLKKKKGIRDTYYLEALASEAEINPVIRHQFKQLYEINLPEKIDLNGSGIEGLFELLASQISASQTGVNLTKIDRPRISLIHEKARRRLDQFRRRARLSGRGIRKYLDLDYSYDPVNFHPLGLKLFSGKVKPSPTNLRTILEERPRPRSFAVPPPDLSSPDERPAVPRVESQRQLYTVQSGGSSNPYEWTFDLCSVTLANFKYRKMSLVQDFEELLKQQPSNASFDAIFSLAPKAVPPSECPPRDLSERFDVVPCDPTQANAIAEASSGKSFIIQGPPGTGKSQTITNLIADFVARGKRVLFVCEKRAAIDVVYTRLRQCGLDELSCLIHDSQTDKKEFVMDLKRTYERFCADSSQATEQDERVETTKRMQTHLQPLQSFDQCMRDSPDKVSGSMRDLIEQCVALKDSCPELDVISKERLPNHADWHDSKSALRKFDHTWDRLNTGQVLADHPLSLLSPLLASEERPVETIAFAASEVDKQVSQIGNLLRNCSLITNDCKEIQHIRQLLIYAEHIKTIAFAGQMILLQPDEEVARWFPEQLAVLQKLQQDLYEAQAATTNWKDKLPPQDTELALQQSEAFEATSLAWLKPAWWRLRAVMRQNYDFSAHKIRPSWSHVLKQLQAEHAAAATHSDVQKAMADYLGVHADQMPELIVAVLAIKEWLPIQNAWTLDLHSRLLAQDDAADVVRNMLQIKIPFEALERQLARISDNFDQSTLEELSECARFLEQNLESVPDFLRCLSELQAASPSVAQAISRIPYPTKELESAVAHQSFESLLRSQPSVKEFSAEVHERASRVLEQEYDQWLHQNAESIRRTVQTRFLEKLWITEQPAARLTPEQKELKRTYNRGRRELEHEFGKQMRYKPIRELVTTESGEVVSDLKPIWLMSPLSVSDTLPLGAEHFDVVIFDEASQITLEEAVPALFRADQSIIVGDEMQLPPTNFFASKPDVEDEFDDLLVDEAGELIQYDLNASSLLSHATSNLSSRMLGWHYRSRSESLISFSNWAFYDGQLLTVPEESRTNETRDSIEAKNAGDGELGADLTLSRSISYHYLENGIYDKRRNRAEAEYIACMVHRLLHVDTPPTIGIVAFSEAQQDEIEQALARLSSDDKAFRDRLESELEREDDGQFTGLLIKNLENIQGDERDIIILSVCYGRPPSGKMRMNFGPINKSGGEKRLNVAFSRAKHQMAVVCSIRPDDITNDFNDGAACLKNYLKYAEAVSIDHTESANRVLKSLQRWLQSEKKPESRPTYPHVSSEISAFLKVEGYEVDQMVGQSHFRCDLAIYRDGDPKYRLAILIDGENYYDQVDILERDMMRPRLLRAFGWEIMHVFAKDWLQYPESEQRRILARLEA